MQTGENEQALRKILDMTRMIAIVILALHFYYYLYAAFRQWHLVSAFSDRLIKNIQNTGLYSNFHKSKLITLCFLAISLLGAKGRKDEKQTHKTAFAYMLTGLLLYFISYLLLLINCRITTIACAYMILTGIGFMLALSGGTLLSRIIKDSLQHDIFNSENETFPQEERLLENEYSINLPARYRFQKQGA
jgi:uncharacterized membrane protein YiaA